MSLQNDQVFFWSECPRQELFSFVCNEGWNVTLSEPLGGPFPSQGQTARDLGVHRSSSRVMEGSKEQVAVEHCSGGFEFPHLQQSPLLGFHFSNCSLIWTHGTPSHETTESEMAILFLVGCMNQLLLCIRCVSFHSKWLLITSQLRVRNI